MTMFTSTSTLITRTGAILGAAILPLLAASPSFAQYYGGNTAAYENCERRDNTTQVIGGVIGASPAAR